MRDLCFIDVETTGTLFGYHEIIEVAALRTAPDGGRVLGEWNHRLRPEHPERITPSAQRVNGFRLDRWADAVPSDHAFWTAFADFARDCTPVCHNPSFDRAFISLAASAVGVEDIGVDYHWIGTESLAWPLHRAGRLDRLSLASLCAYLGVEAEPEVHTAMGGAQACRRAYRALMEQLTLAQPT